MYGTNTVYAKYYTEGFVLTSTNVGEADKMVWLYTREFGLLQARVRAVRTEASRMRYALHTSARADLGLIRGKAGWRIAGVVGGDLLSGQSLSTFARIAQLLLRLVHGEEQHSHLFSILCGTHETLIRNPHRVSVVELITVARILYVLGYLSQEALTHALLSETTYDESHIEYAEAYQAPLLTSVNHALTHTHL